MAIEGIGAAILKGLREKMHCCERAVCAIKVFFGGEGGEGGYPLTSFSAENF